MPLAPFGAESARALLVYLILNPGEAFSRDYLAELLWSELSPDSILANLRTALHRLTHLLRNDQAHPPFLEITRKAVRFNPNSDFWVDVNALNHLFEFTRTHSHRRITACPTCLSYLEHAVGLYRGDLLTGVRIDSQPYEEWMTIHRMQLHNKMMDALGSLALYYEKRRDYTRAEEYIRRHLELEPWREEMHRQLIRLLLLRGQRSAAMAQYEFCRRAMAQSFGVAPDPETSALYEQIVSQKYAVANLVSAPPTQNLPAPQALLVGRERECAQLIELLVEPTTRAVALLGPGGVGKTRLAQEIAWELLGSFDHGIWWAPVGDAGGAAGRGAQTPAPTSELGQLLMSIASALKLVPLGAGGLERQILDYLRSKEALLILDSFELAGGQEVLRFLVRLLDEAPRVLLLIISRHTVNLHSERVLRLGGLPDKVSVDLFLERAQRLRFDFDPDLQVLEDIRQLCILLDGIPLAIEIASAWVSRQTPEQIHQAVQANQEFLLVSNWDAPERHRSLAALYQSSWDLLSQEQRDALARLSVFRGGFDAQAAEAVTGASQQTLAALVDRSLLRKSPTGRLQMQSLLRQFAEEKLLTGAIEWMASDLPDASVLPDGRAGKDLQPGAGLEAFLRNRHSIYFLEYVCQREEALLGLQYQVILQELHLEWANIRTAWFSALQLEQVERLNCCLKGIYRYCTLTGLTGEGRTLVEAGYLAFVEDRPAPAVPTLESAERLALCARLSAYLAGLLSVEGKAELAASYAAQAVEQALLLADQELIAEAHFFSGLVLFSLQQSGDAFKQLNLALSAARRCGAQDIEANTLYLQGRLHFELVKLPQAIACLDQARALFSLQNDIRSHTLALRSLGKIYMYRQDTGMAQTYFKEFLLLNRELGLLSGEAAALENLGMIYAWMHEPGKSRSCLSQSLAGFERVGDRHGQAQVLTMIACTSLFLGDFDQTLPGCEVGLMLYREVNDLSGESAALAILGQLYAVLSRFERAQDASQQALEIARRIGSPQDQANALIALGMALTGLGAYDSALEACQSALALRRGLGQVSGVLDALGVMANLFVARRQPALALEAVEELLSNLAGANTLIDPAQVVLTCYRVLDLVQDRRAAEVLEKAYHQLQTWASRIEAGDEALQRSFWEAVPAHREIRLLARQNLKLPGA